MLDRVHDHDALRVGAGVLRRATARVSSKPRLRASAALRVAVNFACRYLVSVIAIGQGPAGLAKNIRGKVPRRCWARK